MMRAAITNLLYRRTICIARIFSHKISDMPLWFRSTITCQYKFCYYCSSFDFPLWGYIRNIFNKEIAFPDFYGIPLISKLLKIRTTIYQ